jgi:hypothetical protein
VATLAAAFLSETAIFAAETLKTPSESNDAG